ncbi:MAG: histidine kinase [Saprospiraceae bacterium]|nr:histidine kinase [Saprospiraceae bacterium]
MLRNLFIFICLLFACAIAAQQPYFKNYQVRDGLPSNNVYFVFQDSKGYIWLCTDIGVSRFDGSRFTNFTTANGLTDNEVFTCYEDRSGRIWFATLNGKPCFFKDGQIHNEKDQPLLREFNLNSLIFDIFEGQSDGLVMASSRYLGFLSLEKNTAKLVPLPKGVLQAWQEENSKVGVLKSNEIGFFENGEFQAKAAIPRVSLPVKHLTVGHEVYFAYANKLVVYNSFTGKTTKTIGLPPQLSEAISVNVNGENVWVGSRTGVFLLDRKNLGIRQHYLPNSQVTAVLEDREAGWWFSTLDDGIFYVPTPEILYFETPYRINCLAPDLDGRLWMGMTESKVGILQNGQIQIENYFPKTLKPRAINAIHHLPEGRTIIAGKAGVAFLKGNNNEFIRLRSSDANLDREGNLWSGLTGLFYISKTKLPDYQIIGGNINDEAEPSFYLKNPPENLSHLRIDRVVFDENNNPWLASPLGLYHYENGRISQPILPHSIHDLLFENKTGLLWALSEANGLICLKNGQVLDSIRIGTGSTNAICSKFFQDEDGHIWIATAIGLYKVEGSPGSLRLFDYGTVNGLGAEKLNAVAVLNDKVYLGKDDGLLVVPTSLFSQLLPPPLIYLKKCSVNGKELRGAGDLKLASDENALIFNFEGLSYKDFKKLRYRYRLIGLDKVWRTTNNEAVEYASLRPGQYRFEVHALNSAGVISEQPATIAFNIAQPLWMRWWFVLLVLSVLAATIFLWVKWREQKLRNDYEFERRLMTAENEKLELQSKNADLKMLSLRLQMNPHFIFNALNTIKGYYGQDKITQANSYIAKFARLLRLNLDYSDSFIPLEQELELLKIYLQLSQIRYPDKLDFQLIVAPDIIPSAVRIPSMVTQPFVENAVIHGIVGKDGKGHISVVFTKTGDELVVTIRDNGIGRKVAAAKSMLRDPHKPLATSITTERLDLLRKKTVPPSIEIRDIYHENGLAAGTEVVLHLPLENLKN